MPCLYIIAGPDDGTLMELDPAVPVTIGRGLEATLQLVDTQTSRVHCALTSQTAVGGDFGLPITTWTLADSSSSNGTFVGEARVGEDCVLKSGMVFNLGTTHIVFLADDLTTGEEAQQRCTELGITASSGGAWPTEDPKSMATLKKD